MKKEFFYAIMAGVVSGVLTACIIWLIHKFFIKIFTPWFEQRVYKGVLLDGTWTAVTDDPRVLTLKNGTTISGIKRRNLTLNISQKGSHIKGLFYAKAETLDSSKKSINGEEYYNQYSVCGNIKNNYVILNYEAMSKNRTGMGAIVLQIVHGGTKIIGGMAYVGEGRIESISIIKNINFKKS